MIRGSEWFTTLKKGLICWGGGIECLWSKMFLFVWTLVSSLPELRPWGGRRRRRRRRPPPPPPRPQQPQQQQQQQRSTRLLIIPPYSLGCCRLPCLVPFSRSAASGTSVSCFKTWRATSSTCFLGTTSGSSVNSKHKSFPDGPFFNEILEYNTYSGQVTPS